MAWLDLLPNLNTTIQGGSREYPGGPIGYGSVNSNEEGVIVAFGEYWHIFNLFATNQIYDPRLDESYIAGNHSVAFSGMPGMLGRTTKFIYLDTAALPKGARFRVRLQSFWTSGSTPQDSLWMNVGLSDSPEVVQTQLASPTVFPGYEVYSPWEEFTVDPSEGQYLVFQIPDGICSYDLGSFMLEIQYEPGEEPTRFDVYELDRGWSFDGNYIPHFLEMNWYFGEDPIHYHTIQKIRVHGKSKGRALLTVATNGMQTDYEPDYSEPQIIDLPRNNKPIKLDMAPETNTVDSANRGLSIQMKFEGRNEDITKPEPQHVLQVLVVQSSPQGTGHRAN